MIASFNNFVPAVVQLLQCNRRKETSSTSTRMRVTSRNAGVNAVKLASTTRDDSYDSGRSTDVGDSYDSGSAFGTDGSDTDARAANFLYKTSKITAKTMRPVPRPPPGLSAPPGLDAPPGLEAPGSRLNAQAAVFVPTNAAPAAMSKSQQLRNSIHLLKGALEEWETTNLGEQSPKELVGSVEDQTMFALKEALNRLTPKDASMVRNFLTSKEAEENAAMVNAAPMQMPWNAMGANSERRDNSHNAPPPPRHLWGNQGTPVGAPRPFTPFSGGANPKRPQRKPAPTEKIDDGESSLRTNLRDLAEIESGRVLMVRKINRLGMESATTLETYFAKFGVERVMVSHSRSKSTYGQTRLRPATLGHIVFCSVDAAQAVLDAGAEHVVDGIAIGVCAFQSHPVDSK